MKHKSSFWITSTAIHAAIIVMLILFSKPFTQEHIISESLSISSIDSAENTETAPSETPPVETEQPKETKHTEKEEEHKAILEKEENEISTTEPVRKIIPKPKIKETPPPPKIQPKLKSQLKNILKEDLPVAENSEPKKKES